MSLDPTVQLAIVAAINGLLMYWLQHKLGKKVDDNTALTHQVKAEATVAAEKAENIATQNAKALDGQMSEFKAKLTEQTDLKVAIATLVANKAGMEEGTAREKLANLQGDALAAARSLPSTDAKIVNGGKESTRAESSPHQVDRIETTGVDTNVRVQKVETVLGDRIEKVEDDLDTKKDK